MSATIAAEVAARIQTRSGTEAEVFTGEVQQILEAHVREHLAELSEIRLDV